MSTKRVYIHLGAPKTSTTSLQAALLRRRHELADEGIIYPAMKHAKSERAPGPSSPLFGLEDIGDIMSYHQNHGTLFWRAQKNFSEDSASIRQMNDHTQSWQDEIADFRNGDAHTMIISFENPFFTPGNYNMDLVRAPFEGLPITLVAALRHPEDLLHGIYCTHVQEPPHLTEPPGKARAVKLYMGGGFRKLLSACTDALKPDDVLPFYISDLWESDRSLMGAFLERIGVESSTEQDFHARPTLATSEVLFLRKLNRRKLPKPIFARVRKAIHIGLEERTAKRTTSVLREQMQARLNTIYAGDVAWLSETYGLAPPPVIEKAIVPEKLNTTVEEDADILARILPHLTDADARRMTAMVEKLSKMADATPS